MLVVDDATIADPLQQQRRMMIQRALDWVIANPTGATTDTLTSIQIGACAMRSRAGGHQTAC